MDVVQIKNQDTCCEDMSPDQSVSPQISSTWADFREPEAHPRIGDEYQAIIPPLVVKSDDLGLLKSEAGGLRDIYVGFPAPEAGIDDVEILKQKQHNGNDNIVLASNQSEHAAVSEMQDVPEAREVKSSDAMANKDLEYATNFLLQQEMKMKMKESNADNDQWLASDSLNDSSSDIEMASLLLGLYIFGKNLIQVKKFVGTKQMGDILSFYYGKFYGSDKYRRWTACRKARGKRCICGQKLFTGWRQQELSSRLLSSLSEEKKNTVVEVCRGFIEGKILLEEYVFSLKATVGLNALVEAVGIGKGKQDLTSTTMDPIKSNHAHPARPEIPVGKACSTLTPVEIVKFLTGDFRLSKARSSDLFWEAVWPRLLAKGWHSEQANNYGSTVGLKHALVFLIPGVKKYCRRKQVKGEHYFDSVSDVLNKVASDPGLLELDNVVEKQCSDKEECELSGKIKQDQEDFPSQQRYCYLKPRTPVHIMDTIKFMVVDTSLADGSTFKIRELQSLPVEITNKYVSKSHSEEDEQISSEISMDDTHSDNTMHFDKEVSDTSKGTRISLDKKVYIDEETCVGNSSNKESSNDGLDGLHSTSISMEVQEDKQSLLDNTQQSDIVLDQMSEGKPKSEIDSTDYTKPSWELNTCTEQVSCNVIKIFADPELKEEDSSSDHYDLNHNILLQVDSSKENLPWSSLSRSSTITSYGDVLNVVEVPQSRHVPHTFIDLNLPIPQDSDSHGSSTTETKGQKNIPNKCSESLDISDRDSTMISRRQSNRNRPPTTRALEAHALGLLDVKQKRKSKDVFLEENCILRPSQHAHSKARHTDKFGNGIVDFQLEDRESNVSDDNGNMFHKLEV
ncbi:uncharacterized protein LOC101210737 isoform X1 [Cucumis sativus]|uniref:uncharacterized protein LOC101210737 isoform X1 n=2 Tax=Cucumis sativus TaxID=3659 RepID=UPI0005EBFE1E|nr:uncharacterized protein LOC101210737 isoform X1 [Cucumis sativus]KAE8650393.1 hypothetical protein Csa_011384 [Cucumis sativus]